MRLQGGVCVLRGGLDVPPCAFALSSVLLLPALVLKWFTRNVSGSNGFGESGPGFVLCHELQFAVNGTVQPTPASICLCAGAGATVGAAGG